MQRLFLSLFPMFRRACKANAILRTRAQTQRSAGDVLAGALDECRQENARLREELAKASQRAFDAVKMLVNVEYQRTYGVKLYPDALGLPEPAPDAVKPARGDTPQNRRLEFVLAKKKRFADIYVERWKSTHGPEEQMPVEIVSS